ncbi:MAG TPA: DUF222 domain-containing protein [Actinomycetota bacterium]|nr:DUF222 domain-containing protein [Actinomycetota bacterium]
MQHPPTDALIARVHRLDRLIAKLQRRLLAALAELEAREAWLEDGAHDMTHWAAMQLGVSYWKAGRWVAAGRALPALPATADAFERGEIGIDKVVELTRFAEFDDEDALVRWAQGVSSGAIRRIGISARRSGRARPPTSSANDTCGGATRTRAGDSPSTPSSRRPTAPWWPARSSGSAIGSP